MIMLALFVAEVMLVPAGRMMDDDHEGANLQIFTKCFDIFLSRLVKKKRDVGGLGGCVFFVCVWCACVLLLLCSAGGELINLTDSFVILQQRLAHATKQSVTQSSRMSVCFLCCLPSRAGDWMCFMSAIAPPPADPEETKEERRGVGQRSGPGTVCCNVPSEGADWLVPSKPTNLTFLCSYRERSQIPSELNSFLFFFFTHAGEGKGGRSSEMFLVWPGVFFFFMRSLHILGS